MASIKKIICFIMCAFVFVGCSPNAAKLLKPDKYGIINLSDKDLSNYDLSEYEDDLFISNFDTKTKWPEKMPAKFDPDRLLQLGKDLGMNIHKLHEKGITGKNIGIAIIDQPLLKNHNEYKDNLKYFYISNGKDILPFYHGTAVASLAVGKDIGTVPGADLYFIGEFKLTGTGHPSDSDSDIAEAIASDIRHFIKLNKDLKHKIRVISISRGFRLLDNYRVVEKAIFEAKQNDIAVITADTFDDDPIGMVLQRKIYADPNKASSYEPSHIERLEKYSVCQGFSVPMDGRTVASVRGINEYEYDARSGVSWSIPYLAGVYALALQIRPTLSFTKFLKIAEETAEQEFIFNVIAPYKIIENLKNHQY